MFDIAVEKEGPLHLFDLTLKRESIVYKGILGITDIAYEMLKAKEDSILVQKERNHLKSLNNDQQRAMYLRGRFVCKMSVANYICVKDLLSIKNRYGVFNQPLLDAPISVSISHSKDFAACIVFPDELPMRLDLEMIHRNAEELIGSQPTGEEI